MSQSQGCLAGLFGIRGKVKPSRDLDKSAGGDEYPYRVRDDFLSNAELSFYHVLHLALEGKAVICPKVSLAELFFITDKEDYHRYLNMIIRKRIDFLICDTKTMRPLYGIELDDKSHQNPDRIERDRFVDELFTQAGIDLIRFPARPNYVVAEVENVLRMAMSDYDANNSIKPQAALDGAPVCPKCGVPMVKRIAKGGKYAGTPFYGCPNYPQCKEISVIQQANS